MPVSTPVVRMRDVSVGYGDRAVVRDVDLTIGDGEVVAVLGANGSGKTTLVRGLLGLATVLHGDVEVLGRPLRTRHDRAAICYVPQRHTLSNSVKATVREVVEVGRLPHRAWWQRESALDRELVDTALARVGLTDRADTDVFAAVQPGPAEEAK